ncbi:MAG: diguanylate cyclase [Anaerolineaceae bacterium]|nr:diguanylate cyclase [Anaerolineaceae bacterium]
MDTPINVLIIEDNPSDFELLQRYLLKTDTKYLTDATFVVTNANSISAAKLDLFKNAVDIILLALPLPDRYGLSAVATLRKMVPAIPVVILTDVPDEKWALQVIKNGAQDYLIKGEINRHQLIRAIYYAIERHRRDVALRESDARFRASVESMQEGFAIYSAVRDSFGRIHDFVCTYVNDAGCQLNQVSREDLIGRRLLEVFPAHRDTGLLEEYIQVVETGNPLIKDEMEYEDTWAGVRQTRVFDIRINKLGDGFTSVWRDITTQRKTNETLSTYATQMEALYLTSLEINSELDLNLLLSSIVERAVKMTGVSTGLLYLLPPGEQYLELVIGYHLPDHYLGEKLPVGQGLSGTVARTGELMWVPDYQAWEGRLSYFSSTTFRQSLSVPLKFRGRTIGVIDLSDLQTVGPFTDEQIHLTKLFADQAAIAIENARLYSETQQQAITDELTGLYNRRGFAQLGNREVQRSQRFGNPLSAIAIDIDHFKQINDNYGHAAGDTILISLANRIREYLRGLDISARLGGDEFIILLLENDQAAAFMATERIKAQLTSMPYHADSWEIQVSLSMGVAGVTKATHDLPMLLQQADQALYQAKKAGGNRVCQYNQPIVGWAGD